MAIRATQAVESANADDCGQNSTRTEREAETIDERDQRAIEEYLTVLDDVGMVAGAADMFLVVSESGSEYVVDVRGSGACECPDATYRDVTCKHQRRVKFATGMRPIPTRVDRDGVDEQLGEHVDGSPEFAGDDQEPTAMADGGTVAVEVEDAEADTASESSPVAPTDRDLPGGWECVGEDERNHRDVEAFEHAETGLQVTIHHQKWPTQMHDPQTARTDTGYVARVRDEVSANLSYEFAAESVARKTAREFLAGHPDGRSEVPAISEQPDGRAPIDWRED